MLRFIDIQQMTQANYSCHHLLYMLPETIEKYQDDEGVPLDMNPDFQRAHVWTPEQQTRYVEFILQGGNSSKDFYFNCPGWMGDWKGPFELVDGKQRLEACLGFMSGKVPIFNGLRIRDFGDKPFNVALCFHINNLKTRREILQWYLDINAGGITHTHDELEKVRALLRLEKAKE